MARYGSHEFKKVLFTINCPVLLRRLSAQRKDQRHRFGGRRRDNLLCLTLLLFGSCFLSLSFSSHCKGVLSRLPILCPFFSLRFGRQTFFTGVCNKTGALILVGAFELKLLKNKGVDICATFLGCSSEIVLRFFDTFIKERSMYYVCSNIVKPLTEPFQMSFVELIGPTKIQWFVSHYWGMPVRHFGDAIRKHAQSYDADWRDAAYWICTFSNSQWHVQEELGHGRWQDSSFYLALKSPECKGTTMVIDELPLPADMWTTPWWIYPPSYLRGRQRRRQRNVHRSVSLHGNLHMISLLMCGTWAAKVRNKRVHSMNGNGGGSRATRRKRSEKEPQFGNFGPGLSEDIVSQLVQLLTLLQSLLSQFASCNKGASNNVNFASLLSSFVQNSLFGNKPKLKKKRKKKPVRTNKASQPVAAKPSQPATAGKEEQKQTKPVGASKANTAKETSPPIHAPRTFADVVKDAKGDPPFQPVWQLRAADWDGEILSFDEIAQRLGSDEKPIKAVALISSECELEELKTLVESEAQPDRHVGVTAVLPSTKGVDVPKSAGEFTQVPGKTRGKLVPRMSHVFSIGVSCPKLKKQVRTVESAPSVAPTVVLRFSTEAKYHEDPRWRGIVDNAGGAAHKWIHANVPAAMQRQIRDIWSWQLQSSKGGGKALITSLMRVELSAAKTLLSLSGQGAWFIEPLRWDQPDIPTCQVRWEKRLPDESGHVYAARVLSMAGNLSLARGLKNLGVRVPPASDKKVATTKVKTWKVTGVPRDWSQAAGLSNLQLTSRKPHGRTTCLFFTAECAQGTDFVELVFGNITITAAAFSPMKRMRSETQQLKTVSSLSFSPAFGQTRGSAEVQPAQRSSFYAASPVKVKPKAAAGHSQDTASAEATEKQPPVAVEASQPSEVKDVEMTSPAKAATKRMGGSPEKAAKPPPKKRAVVRDAPKGLTRVPNSAQGNCLFESIAQGLNPDNPKHARAIRAAVIAHLKRHADRYQPWWDNLRPDEEICDSWEEYLRLVSKAGAYAGCLEIAAAAAHFDRTIFVFCPFLAEPEAYNQSSKKGCICLWFQDQHYEYLKGDLNPELGSQCLAPPGFLRCHRRGHPSRVALQARSQRVCQPCLRCRMIDMLRSDLVPLLVLPAIACLKVPLASLFRVTLLA